MLRFYRASWPGWAVGLTSVLLLYIVDALLLPVLLAST